MRKLAALFTAVGLSAVLAVAQGPGPRNPGGPPPDPQAAIEMRVNSLARRLTLTDVQKTNATAIFTDSYTASQGPQASLEGTRQSLSDAVKKNETASIDQLSATLGALTGQVTVINSKAEAAFYLILTPDQQAKYDTMPQRGLRGPGGPMRPGGGAGPSRMRRGRGQ